MRTLLSVLSLGLLAPLAACNGQQPGGQLVKSRQSRISAASVDPSVVAAQAADNTQLAFDVYAQLKGTPGNLFFSPYSISSAMTMAWAGAAGNTATQMASALELNQSPANVLGAFNALDAALASRGQSGSSEGGGPFQLNVVNAIWTQQGAPLEAPFLDALAENFGAGVRTEKFSTAPEAARADINAWVDDNTGGKIPTLLQPGTVTSDSRLFLTNAVYFDGSWDSAFDAQDTKPAPFNALDGTTPTVQMMNQTYSGRYSQGTGWQAIDLPYSNNALTLTVIVPDMGQFASIETQLSATFLAGVLAAEEQDQITLGLPKFTATTKADLVPTFKALGLTDAFTSLADFSGIDGAKDLAISTIVHQAVIDVDEKGTKAAAATAIGIGATSGMTTQKSVTLTVDRPFFIVLRDIPTNTALFVGRITQLQ